MVHSQTEFAGKVAIVTGGSKGVGAATVRRLLQGGARVAFCSNDKASLSSKDESNLVPFYADCSKDSDMRSFIDIAVSTFGGVDLLVNCAGIQHYGSVVNTEEEDWDKVMAVNLKGCYLSSRYAIPAMQNRGGGAIVNVSSVQAFACQTNVAAYAASKGGLNALTRAMALDHANDNIRVNVVCPGSVDTPMLRQSAELFKGNTTQERTLKSWADQHPLGSSLKRLCSADEVAELIAFLLSDRATYITGAEYKIDGALLAGIAVTLTDTKEK